MDIKISDTEKQRILELHNSLKSTINEQNAAYSAGQKTGQQAAAATKQFIKGVANDVYKALKQTTITIGKTIFYLVVGYGYVIYYIGNKAFKVSLAASNALIKLLSATGKVIIGAAQALTQNIAQGLTNAGIVLSQGLQVVKQKLSTMADSIVGVAKWGIMQMKQFGVKIYAQILIGASQIKEFGAQIANWVSSQWGTVQKQIGIAWDQAKSMGVQAIQNIKQGVQAVGQKVKQGVQDVGQKVKQGAQYVGDKLSQGAGAVSGFVQGMFEYFERFFSFEATDTLGLLRECMKYNEKEIIS